MAKDTSQFVPYVIVGDYTELFAELVDELEEAEANWVRTGNEVAKQHVIRTSRRIYLMPRALLGGAWEQPDGTRDKLKPRTLRKRIAQAIKGDWEDLAEQWRRAYEERETPARNASPPLTPAQYDAPWTHAAMKKAMEEQDKREAEENEKYRKDKERREREEKE